MSPEHANGVLHTWKNTVNDELPTPESTIRANEPPQRDLLDVRDMPEPDLSAALD